MLPDVSSNNTAADGFSPAINNTTTHYGNAYTIIDTMVFFEIQPLNQNILTHFTRLVGIVRKYETKCNGFAILYAVRK